MKVLYGSTNGFIKNIPRCLPFSKFEVWLLAVLACVLLHTSM